MTSRNFAATPHVIRKLLAKGLGQGGWGVPITHHAVGGVLSCLPKCYEAKDYPAHSWTGRHAVTIKQTSARIARTIGHNGTTKMVFGKDGHLIPDPHKAPIWLHSCHYANGCQQRTTYHTACISAQMDAGLVDKGCRWCPQLDHLELWQQQMWGRQTYGPTGPFALDDGSLS